MTHAKSKKQILGRHITGSFNALSVVAYEKVRVISAACCHEKLTMGKSLVS